MNPLTATIDTIIRADAFELFGVLSFESLQQIHDAQGRLDESTIQAVDRVARKFSLRLHPDKNQGSEETREAFEHVRRSVEFIKNAAELFKHAQKAIGSTQQETKRVDGMSKALAAGAKLEQRMAAEQELRRQQQARAAAELQVNLSRMKSSDAASSFSSSSSSKDAVAKEILSRERRKQMTEWERLEEEMLQDWDVDAETLKKKEQDMVSTMKWLEARHVESQNAGVLLSQHKKQQSSESNKAANIAAIMAKLGGGAAQLPNRRDRQ